MTTEQSPWDKHERDNDEELRAIQADELVEVRHLMGELFILYVSQGNTREQAMANVQKDMTCF